MAKISLEEYQNFKAEGLHDKEIAQKVDMNFQYLSQLKKQWGIRPEINHPAKKKPPMTKTIKADKTIEYEQLIQALRNDLKDAHTQLDEKDEQVQKLEKTIEKYKHIEAACEDVEEELIGLRAENQELQRQLEAAPLPVIETKDDDIINHPNHYHKNGIDVIAFSELQFDEAELKGFYRINCLKYITRFDRKNKIEDLKKADFYLGKLIEMESVK